jgi:hypothetical protein
MGGRETCKPVGISMVVVTRKKTNSRNAMSAIDPAFISGMPLLFLDINF